MRRKIILIVSILTLLFVLVLVWFSFHILRFISTPLVTSAQPVIIVVAPGTPVVKLAWQLHDAGVLKQPKYFIQLARLRGALNRIQAGEYSITAGTTPDELLTKLIKGEVLMHKVTLVEGWTFNQMMTAINNNAALTHTLQNQSPVMIMAAIGQPGKNPEGMFYPNTYLFKRDTKDSVILRSAYQLMQNKLQQAWQTRDNNLPYQNPYQALIVASMIERESRLNAERARVAGVILRRLQKNMPLQIDATVIYGLGSRYDGSLSHNDMKIDTAYNTYTRRGLPPSPIAMPGLNSINAALHPSMGTALYYVAKGDGSGSHIFSDTFKDHNRALIRYLIPNTKKLNKIIPISISASLLVNSWLGFVTNKNYCVFYE